MKRMLHIERMRDRILIIGSESSLGEEMAPALAKVCFSVARVPNYAETLLTLEVFKPDIIILDEALADSIEACRQLHTTFGIPVILIGTDSSQEIWKKALLDAEADFYLRKPVSHAVLVARMRAILRRYRQRGDYGKEAGRVVRGKQYTAKIN